MHDLQQQIARLIEEFTGKVGAVAQQTVMQTVRIALGGDAPTRARQPVARAATPSPARRGAAGGDAAAAGARLVSHLLSSPGQRMNDMATRFQLPVASVQTLIKKLVASGMVRFEGNTRARKYFAANGATSSTGKRGKRGKRGKQRRAA
jgi:hypothetical protein